MRNLTIGILGMLFATAGHTEPVGGWIARTDFGVLEELGAENGTPVGSSRHTVYFLLNSLDGSMKVCLNAAGCAKVTTFPPIAPGAAAVGRFSFIPGYVGDSLNANKNGAGVRIMDSTRSDRIYLCGITHILRTGGGLEVPVSRNKLCRQELKLP